jgi:deoxyribodipyrimidine photo-lyase
MNIFLHHRDLRKNDNTTLNNMYKELDEPIIPIFIFPPEQIDPAKNKYFSNNLVQFMCESLVKLNMEYDDHLHFYEGDTVFILNKLHKKYGIKNIGFNLDYSPFARKRDSKIKSWAMNNNINIFAEEDMLLVNIMGDDVKIYRVFTPFYKYLMKTFKINKPVTAKIKTIQFNKTIPEELSAIDLNKFFTKNNKINVKSGRDNALKKLMLIKNQQKYNTMRDFMSYNTTHLSAYINLGLLSIREVYHYCIKKLGNNNFIPRELYWRDFYYNILYFFPHVVGGAYREQYNKLEWNNDKKMFKLWCEGKTGFPIVDACMRQLNETGFMHNRGRMIVASFLTKDLLIDWRWGERYFATKLEDYNVAANNGGWQWSAGTGSDSQPYFRIFNPWSQSLKYDKECIYIKKWVPELKDVDNKDIHNWFECYDKYDIDYPKPIVDHSKVRLKTLKIYKKTFNSN